MILSEGLVLQQKSYWKDFLGKEIVQENNSSRKNERRKIAHWLLISLCIIIIIIFISLILLNSPYLNWDYSNPENAVLGVAFHSFEWLFIRTAPIVLIVLIIRIFLTKKKD